MHRIIPSLTGLIFIVGCSQPNAYVPPPPPSVTVARPLVRTVTNYLEETGTTEPVERVEIRARVQGYLQEVRFQDGQDVKQGDPLYLIQPREYEANVAAAKAAVQSMDVSLTRAEIEVERQQNLLKDNATAKSNVDTAIAERDGALAALDAAKARLDLAQQDLEYTAITAPFDGRVERTLIREGNLVGGSEETLLTTVIKYDPIFVYFNINERALLEATKTKDGESRERMDLTQIKASLRRTLDKGFPFEGHLDYADLGVDQSTGTFTLRAIFPNPHLKLLPGLFVRIRVPLGTTENAVLLPERCVAADQAGRYVMIVDGDQNLVERRNVTLGARFGEMVVVIEGLDGSETVVIDGLQRARPGVEVTPTVIELDGTELSEEPVAEENAGEPESGDSDPSSADSAESVPEPVSAEPASAPPSDGRSSTEPGVGESDSSSDASVTPSER